VILHFQVRCISILGFADLIDLTAINGERHFAPQCDASATQVCRSVASIFTSRISLSEKRKNPGRHATFGSLREAPENKRDGLPG
jgi:hypothetical protein